jgi:hypothetical protein
MSAIFQPRAPIIQLNQKKVSEMLNTPRKTQDGEGVG